ncbi:AzlC family ABC transporter permease [Roseivivax isoporae]|uniref:Branched-chain amino acid transporter AzlC n=1 Tax=Roseivivax isoporae LMG 25204 TaxID=1449351 RepID=X7FCL1_9RHOB|nr:AzlC family ABC transporter permease [Roseivivax isoporae]ETX30520.1 branched-chain amino acid transporter AzlC [Roseivivax isoporae LMG 25204]
MAASAARSSYMRGLRDGLPFLAVILPFGMLFGVVATEAGLSIFEALAFSIVVIAGAAQFTALQLLNDAAPLAVVIASALAVNLRMAMYSASMTPHLGALPMWKRALVAYFLVDQTYALSQMEFEAKPLSLTEKLGYFLGTVTPICLPWYGATVVGAWAGAAIPPETGIDFAVPLAFLAMIGGMLRTTAHRWAAAAAAVVAVGFAWLPWNLGLIVGGVAGMVVGAQVELWTERREAAKVVKEEADA